jgi:hypothetical protein
VMHSAEYDDPRVRKATGHLAELLFAHGARDQRAKALLRLRAPGAVRSLSGLRNRLRRDRSG